MWGEGRGQRLLEVVRDALHHLLLRLLCLPRALLFAAAVHRGAVFDLGLRRRPRGVHRGGGALAQAEPLGPSLLRDAAGLLGVRCLLLEARQQALPRRGRPPQPGGHDVLGALVVLGGDLLRRLEVQLVQLRGALLDALERLGRLGRLGLQARLD